MLLAFAPILGRYEDDVPEDTKLRRLKELIDAFRAGAQARNTEMRLGTEQLVLVEGPSRRSTEEEPRLTGRTGRCRGVRHLDPMPQEHTQIAASITDHLLTWVPATTCLDCVKMAINASFSMTLKSDATSKGRICGVHNLVTMFGSESTLLQ